MDEKTTAIWDKYQKGVDHHNAENMYTETERFHQFYAGNQWFGAQVGNKQLPVINFIKPVGKYKISMIAQNNMAIVFSDMSDDPQKGSLCELLNALAAQTWEKAKMDMLSWETIKNAFIAGDHYAYWHDDRDQYGESIVANRKPSLKCRLINKTNIYLADEQNQNIQEQDYIIISERVPVGAIKRIAKKNGVDDEDIALIGSDDDTTTQIGENTANEVKSDEGKCTSLLYITKKESENKTVIAFCRSVKNVIYQPEQVIEGLDVYPIAGFRWESFIGTARGISGVKQMLPNQILTNRIAAWRGEAVKKFAFPKPVIVEDKVSNPEALDIVGATIKLTSGSVENIRNYIDYINPAPVSSDAEKLFNDVISMTREMEGAGDAATGAIDPTKASGEAIKAARDQAAVPLNEQVAAYKQYVEDTATIWFKLWAANAVNGLQVDVDGKPANIPREDLEGMDVAIKIDVTPVDPYSRVSREVLTKELFQAGAIDLEEYVFTLSNTSSMPKKELLEIIEARKSKINPELMEILEGNPEIADKIMQLFGGDSTISEEMAGDADVLPKM